MTAQIDIVAPDALESLPGYAARWKALIFVCLALLVISVDIGILNVALPSISRSLGASGSELQWIVDAYILVFASLVLTMGALDDKIGRKRGLQIGLLLFGLGSLGGAFSTTAGMLTLMRGFTGIGGALIMPATLSIVNASFPVQERAQAFAMWATVYGLGGGIGPIAGGLLIKFFSWQAIFLVNLPLVAVAILGGRAFITESRDEHAPALDPPGVLLSIVGLVALVYGIISAGDSGWTTPEVLSAFGVAVVVLSLFVIWECRAPKAMLPLRFFANPSFALANTAVVLNAFSFFGLIFMLTQYFQSVLGYDALTVGIIQLPIVIAVMIFSSQSAKIVQRFGTKRTVASGALLVGAALLYLHFVIDVNTPYALIFIAEVVIGAGFGLTTSPATNSVMQSVPVRKSGIGSAMNDTTRQVGGALGIAILGSILNGVYRGSLALPLQALPQIPDPARQVILRSIQGAHVVASQLPGNSGGIINAAQAGFVSGMQQALLLAALVMFGSAVLMFLLLPDHAQRSPE